MELLVRRFKMNTRKITLDYFKKFKIQVILRHNALQGSLCAEQLDFIDVDNKYHSFLVLFNSTRIFCTTNKLYLGNCNDIMVNLEKSHRVFDSRSRWIEGRFKDITNKDIENFCKNLQPVNKSISYNRFKLDRIELIFNPIFTYVVDYSYNEVAQKSLILVADQITDCSNLYKESQDFYNFMCLCELQHLIRV